MILYIGLYIEMSLFYIKVMERSLHMRKKQYNNVISTQTYLFAVMWQNDSYISLFAITFDHIVWNRPPPSIHY